mgnify:CR=1 FL=1
MSTFQQTLLFTDHDGRARFREETIALGRHRVVVGVEQQTDGRGVARTRHVVDHPADREVYVDERFSPVVASSAGSSVSLWTAASRLIAARSNEISSASVI